MARVALSALFFSSVVGFVACSSSDDGGARPNANGASNSGATGGSGGSNAGSGGSSGTSTTTAGTSSGGSGGSGVTAFTCAGTALTSPEITDFTTLGAMNTWGAAPGATGGLFVYPPAMTVDTSAGNMTVSGNVADYSGFGVYFNACSDASAFDGLSFDISGNVGPSAKLKLSLQTHSDYPVDSVNMKGGCVYTSEATKHTECVPPSVTVDIPEGGGTLTVAWADFAAGKPVVTADPSEIIGIQLAFSWAGATDTAYDVEASLDNVHFLGDEVPGGGGAGGADGAAGAGSSTGGADSGLGGAGGAG